MAWDQWHGSRPGPTIVENLERNVQCQNLSYRLHPVWYSHLYSSCLCNGKGTALVALQSREILLDPTGTKTRSVETNPEEKDSKLWMLSKLMGDSQSAGRWSIKLRLKGAQDAKKKIRLKDTENVAP
jgi:hypothetical protein